MNKLITQYAQYFELNMGRTVSTSQTYTRLIERLDKFLKKRNKTLLTADRVDLEDFTGPWAHSEGMKPASRRPLIAAVRSFYVWLHDQEHITHKPAESLSYPKAGKPLPNVISRNNAEKLLMSCDMDEFIGVRDAAIIALLIATGMRVSGVSKLNQEQFYTHTDESGKDIQMLRVEEKGRKERMIPVDPVAMLYLAAYLKHPVMTELREDLLLEDGEHVMFIQLNRGKCKPHEWLGERRRLSVQGIQRLITRRGTKLGIPHKDLHPHAFRHLFGTELAESDIDVHKISLLMGHSSPTYTGVYVHLAVKKLRDIVHSAGPMSKMETHMNKLNVLLARKGAV